MNTNSEKEIFYIYDINGICASKTVDGVKTEYYTIDGRITGQKTGNSLMTFRYDEENSPISFNYNGTEYFYMKNIQGDIVAILNSNGSIVVEYTYDAWGKVVSTTGNMASTVGAANSFRYRGYYYDTETGLYSLQSRYYDPEIGRFLNADVPEMLMLASLTEDVLGTNLFAYCNNDPINRSDPTGLWSITISASFIRQKVNNFFGNMMTRYVNNVPGLVGIFMKSVWPFLKPFISIPVKGWIVAAVVAILATAILTPIATAYIRNKGIRLSTKKPYFSFV